MTARGEISSPIYNNTSMNIEGFASLAELALDVRWSWNRAADGESGDAVDAAKRVLDPNVLTLGFARRFATYKRPNLLLHDPQRLIAMLTNSQRPVQLIIAGEAIVQWQRQVNEKWSAVRFGSCQINTNNAVHDFEVQVYLHDLNPTSVRVELFANAVNNGLPVRQEMKCVRQLTGAVGGYAYQAAVPASRPAADFTARIVPYFGGVSVPLEADCIVWQR